MLYCTIGCGRVNLGKSSNGICLPCKAAARKRYLDYQRDLRVMTQTYDPANRVRMIYG